MSKVLLGRVPNTSMRHISKNVWEYWESRYDIDITPTVRKGVAHKKIWGTPISKVTKKDK